MCRSAWAHSFYHFGSGAGEGFYEGLAEPVAEPNRRAKCLATRLDHRSPDCLPACSGCRRRSVSSLLGCTEAMIQSLSILGFAALGCYLLVRVAMSATVANPRPASFIFWLCFVSAVLALFASAFWLTSAVRNSEAFA